MNLTIRFQTNNEKACTKSTNTPYTRILKKTHKEVPKTLTITQNYDRNKTVMQRLVERLMPIKKLLEDEKKGKLER